MNINKINTERVVSIVGCMFLLCAGICSLFIGGHPKSIIEYIAPTKVVIPTVHFICCLFSFFTIFKPNYYYLTFILIVESNLTILTEYETLGIFFFYASLSLIIIKDMWERKRTVLIVVLTIIHFLALIGSYPFGILQTIISVASSIFVFAFCLWILTLLRAQFSCYLPKNITENEVMQNKKHGAVISLSEYNLTERQKKFLLANLQNKSYKEISSEYYVSISLVKKEFSEIFRVFAVTNLNELRILLRQYQIEE